MCETTDMELTSDILVIAGMLVVIAALAAIWWPLGLLTLGLALIAMGFLFHVRGRAAKAAKAK